MSHEVRKCLDSRSTDLTPPSPLLCQALQHSYFFTPPAPCPRSQMPLPPLEKPPPPASQEYNTNFPLSALAHALHAHLDPTI